MLVAYNVWVSSAEVARRVAPLVRGPEVRALGLAVGDAGPGVVQPDRPGRCGPAELYDAVAALVAEAGGTVHGGELVGLLPEAVLAAVPPSRWRRARASRRRRRCESRLPAG